MYLNVSHFFFNYIFILNIFIIIKFDFNNFRFLLSSDQTRIMNSYLKLNTTHFNEIIYMYLLISNTFTVIFYNCLPIFYKLLDSFV